MGCGEHASRFRCRSNRLEGLHPAAALFQKDLRCLGGGETTEAAETFGDVDPATFPELHRFQVPEGCHWRDIRETPVTVGTALLRAMQEIERANPDTLYCAFGTADWGNHEKFTANCSKI